MKEGNAMETANWIWKMVKDIMMNMEMSDLEDCFGTAETEQILEMDVAKASNKYVKWKCKSSIKSSFFRGDVVMISGIYYVIIGFWGDSKEEVDVMTPDGRIEHVTKDSLEDAEMHLNLNVVPVNGIVSFLRQLQKNLDERGFAE